MIGRKVIGLVIILASLLSDKATATQYAFRVTFTDKNNTPYSLSSPLVFLSSRALTRRSNQSIALDSSDLPVNPDYVGNVLSATGGKLHTTSRWLNSCVILLNDSTQILTLAGQSYISSVKRVGVYTVNLHKDGSAYNSSYNTIQPYAVAQRVTTPGASYYGATWTQSQLVNGNYLHDNGYEGQGKLIAVIDAGFYGANIHPGFDSMWSSGRVVDTFNFTYKKSWIFDYDTHGTQVLSTMAGYIPGSYVGTAPKAMYALYVTEFGPGDQPIEMDNMISAAERADSLGADVITESLGYDLFDDPADGQNFNTDLNGRTTIAAIAANTATKKGILFVATAGNDGTGIPGWGSYILTPGDADSALTIGAVDYTGNVANYTGYGPNAVGRTKPDVCGMGSGASIFDNGVGYATSNGTSFSTPQIAGWAACLWQAKPNSTPFQLRQAITKCASSYSTPGVQLGYGIPNFQCTADMLDVLNSPLPFSTSEWVIATPNPFSDNLRLSISPKESQDVTLILTDITGKIVTSSEIFLYKGYNTPLYLPVPGLPKGLYILKAISSTQQQVIRLEKL